MTHWFVSHTDTNKLLKDFIEKSEREFDEEFEQKAESTKRPNWQKLALSDDVTIKNKWKSFSPGDVKNSIEVIDRARSTAQNANAIVNTDPQKWSPDTKVKLKRYFFITGDISEAEVMRIRTVITATRTMLEGKLVIKIDDLEGTRAKVPQSSESFIKDRGIEKKTSWIEHSDSNGLLYAAGIRLDRDYLNGSFVNDHPTFAGTASVGQIDKIPNNKREENHDEFKMRYLDFSLTLRVKTLIHEMTHRACNTKDNAYFKDDGRTLSRGDKAPVPPAEDETEKWLDNADSYGWFCVGLAGLV